MIRLALAALLLSGIAFAQNAPAELQHGSQEVEFFAQGGHSVAGGRGDTGVFNAGLRYGYVVGRVGGSSALRGAFEYAIEATPVWVFSQPSQNAYGVGISPINLKYNFTSGSRFTPYLEINGGVLFTNHDVPPGTNDVNFTSGATLGMHLPVSGSRFVSLAAKYVHVSNAGLAVLNPGVNTFQVRLGFGKWFK